MQQTQPNIYAQYENEIAAISPFAQARMGLKGGLTAIKLDTYNIVCMPFRLSMKSGILLASFSGEELSFFQKYVNGLAGLTLVFQPTSSQTAIKIFARCVVKTVSAMKGREAVGLIAVEWKPCPPDLQSTLGDYFMLVDRLKVEYGDFKGKMISINAVSAKSMGYNNYCLLTIGDVQAKVALYALASDILSFLVPMNGPQLEVGKPVQIKLFFQSFQFAVQGSVSDVSRLGNGVQKASVAIQFSAELVAIIENYRFAETFGPKAPTAPGTQPEPKPQ